VERQPTLVSNLAYLESRLDREAARTLPLGASGKAIVNRETRSPPSLSTATGRRYFVGT